MQDSLEGHKNKVRERIWLATMHSRACKRAIGSTPPGHFAAPRIGWLRETRSQEEDSALAYAPHV